MLVTHMFFIRLSGIPKHVSGSPEASLNTQCLFVMGIQTEEILDVHI